ncbi:MAG TPA: substrate-binding domain-containing protein [Streptosporangiaceae bacterium]|nr:substrate-binding domain-containing protein [Streptosporangiaceae bacterium]
MTRTGPTRLTAGGGMRLRMARQARGLSQQQLAGMAEVSRQAVSAVESGHCDPSLRVALALAQALGMTVEEVFGPGDPPAELAARPLARLGGPGARAAVAPVGDNLVALPLAGDTATRAGFLPAGGLVGGRSGTVRPIGPPRPTLVVAGCDPALPLLETPLSLLDPPVAFAWWPCGSEQALRLAADGLVHAAGAHLRGADGEYNTAQAAALLGGDGAEVIGFSGWREGLALAPRLAGQVAGIRDLARLGVRVVNREPGSEARQVLDRELLSLGLEPDALAGYETTATGHLQVASAIAAGLAEAGISAEPAALAYGLPFVPLTDERFDLVIPHALAESREAQSMVRALSSPWLLAQLESLPGYDAGRCGQHVTTLRAT